MNFRRIFKLSILITVMGTTFSFSQTSETKKTKVLPQETTFEQKFGIGLIKMVIGPKIVHKFYQNPKEKKPFRTLNWEQVFTYPRWFNPKHNRADGYGHVLFVYHSNQPGWFEIELNSWTKKIAWVKEEEGYTFKAWGEFLTEVYNIEINKTTVIHEKPDANTPPMVFHKDAEVIAIGHKGNWLQVKERFEWVAPPENHQTKTGWLKWRDEKDFLIKYNLNY